jgi:pyruvate formate lyase activating enzyme
MNFYGFQKVTLLDYPGKVACTVFTGGCNLRCPFCHNGTLVKNPAQYRVITSDEVLQYLSKRGKALDGICVTGGEPLLHDLEAFLTEVKRHQLLIKLDHNGTMPDKLESLIQKGLLDYVAVDIKGAPSQYARAVGVSNFDTQSIFKTIELLRQNKVKYEFRTTVVKGIHEEHHFRDIANMIHGAPRYVLQQYVDSGDILHDGNFASYTPQELQGFADIVAPHVERVEIRGI